MSTSLENKWSVISQLMKRGHRKCLTGGKVFLETRPSESYNLPLVLAYSLLDEVLSGLESNGLFNCPSWMLGAKMKASKAAINWVDYGLVEEGKDKRNDLAHQGVMLKEQDCRKYVEAVKVELKTWGGLSG